MTILVHRDIHLELGTSLTSALGLVRARRADPVSSRTTGAVKLDVNVADRHPDRESERLSLTRTACRLAPKLPDALGGDFAVRIYEAAVRDHQHPAIGGRSRISTLTGSTTAITRAAASTGEH